MRSAVILTILACCALPASAQASNLVFVCGKDLCAARGDGSNRVRQARDGRADRFSSPSVSRSGKRIAFTRRERGRVHTARLARRNGAITRLRGLHPAVPYGFDSRRPLSGVGFASISPLGARQGDGLSAVS